jgi:hypothetical protein
MELLQVAAAKQDAQVAVFVALQFEPVIVGNAGL